MHVLHRFKRSERTFFIPQEEPNAFLIVRINQEKQHSFLVQPVPTNWEYRNREAQRHVPEKKEQIQRFIVELLFLHRESHVNSGAAQSDSCEFEKARRTLILGSFTGHRRKEFDSVDKTYFKARKCRVAVSENPEAGRATSVES